MMRIDLQLFGGRGSKSGMQAPTHARDIPDMNEAQIRLEIQKEKRKAARAQEARERIAGAEEAAGRAQREAFPLGTGGFTREEAERIAGRAAERSARAARQLSAAMQRKEDAERRLQNLRTALNDVKGTDKTQNQIAAERRAEAVRSAPKTMKWTTVQKESMQGGVLTPRVIRSGNIEIRGKSVLRIYKDGVQVGVARTLAEAKAAAERLR